LNRATLPGRSQRKAEDLRFAAADGDVSRVERLLKEGAAPNGVDELGLTALHYAARGEHLAVVTLLIAYGADVNAHDHANIGNTPICTIAATCSLQMARLLIDAGANPTIRGWMQRNALDQSRGRKRGEGPQVHDLLVKAAQRWTPGAK
jgi:ankyrin repeat protein